MIGEKKTVSPEFTVYKVKDCYETGPPLTWYVLELDGAELALDRSLAEIHKTARAVAKDRGLRAPGLTEAFGRNRQFIQGPRGGWTRYKGE